MARNLREGSLGQVNVRVTSDVSGGYIHTENGVTGVAVTDAAAGEVVALDRRPYVHYLFANDNDDKGPWLPHATSDELGPGIPGYQTELGTAVAGDTVQLGGMDFAIVEIGPGDVYNTPAGYTLVTVLP